MPGSFIDHPLVARTANLQVASLLYLRALNEERLANPDGAAAYYRSAIELVSDFAPAHRGLAIMAVKRNDPASAIPHLESALAAAGDDPVSHFALGRLRPSVASTPRRADTSSRPSASIPGRPRPISNSPRSSPGKATRKPLSGTTASACNRFATR